MEAGETVVTVEAVVGERGEKTLGAREETVDLTVVVVVSAVVVAMVVVVVVVVVVVEVVVVAKVELMDVFVVVLTEGEALDGLAVRAGGLGQPRGDGPGGWEGRHCFLVFLKPFTHLLVSSIQSETFRYLFNFIYDYSAKYFGSISQLKF